MPSVEERLAVVETKVTAIEADVSEIKLDVKALLNRAAKSDGITQFGKFIIPAIALVVSVAAFVRGG
jgi:hypothetical protein